MVIEIKHSIEEYLNKIRSYLKDIMNDLKKSDIWKSNKRWQLISYLLKVYMEY